jgi:hypothetical protein
MYSTLCSQLPLLNCHLVSETGSFVYVCPIRNEFKYILFRVVSALCRVVCLWLLGMLLVTCCMCRESCPNFVSFTIVVYEVNIYIYTYNVTQWDGFHKVHEIYMRMEETFFLVV